MFWGLISICVTAARQIYHDVRIERDDQISRKTPTPWGTFHSIDGREKWADTCTPVTTYTKHNEFYVKDLKTKQEFNFTQVQFEQQKEDLIQEAKGKGRTVIKYGRDLHNSYDQKGEVKGQRFYDIETGQLLVARKICFDGKGYCCEYFCSLDGKIVRKTDYQKIEDHNNVFKLGHNGELKSGYYCYVGTKTKRCYIQPNENQILVERYNNDLEYRNKCVDIVINSRV